jgi:hypothetical protein
MHQGPLRARAIERFVGQFQPLGVAQAVLERQTEPDRAPAGLGEHHFAVVHPDDPAARRDQARERPCVVTGAAAEVEQSLADPRLEQRRHPALARLHRGQLVGRIHEAHEELRVDRRVDPGEALDRRCLCHRAPRPSVSRNTVRLALGMRPGLLIVGRGHGWTAESPINPCSPVSAIEPVGHRIPASPRQKRPRHR